MNRRRRGTTALMLATLLSAAVRGAEARGQTGPPVPPAAPQSASPALPVDLNRIKLVLEQHPSAALRQQGLRIYVEVRGRRTTFEDLLGSFDLRGGPVPGAGMTHQEFLGQVTPKALYSSGGITGWEQLQFAAVNYLAWQGIRKLYKELSEAKTAYEKERINKRIDRELAALKGGK